MKQFYHPSWIKWHLTVDPVKLSAREFNDAIKDTNLIAWYFEIDNDAGMLYLQGQLEYDKALEHALNYKEILESGDGSLPGEA